VCDVAVQKCGIFMNNEACIALWKTGPRSAKKCGGWGQPAGDFPEYGDAPEDLEEDSGTQFTAGLPATKAAPLWRRNKAEIETAQFTTAQAEKMLQSTELKAEMQVRQAFTTYQLM